MTLHQVPPSAVNFGDQVVINKHLCTVKFIDGPDASGAYDLYVHDNATGQDRQEVVTEAITLAL